MPQKRSWAWDKEEPDTQRTRYYVLQGDTLLPYDSIKEVNPVGVKILPAKKQTKLEIPNGADWEI